MTAVDDLLAYFANGGPDTPIRTTWPGGAECWEVPAADLRPLLEALEAEGGGTTCIHRAPSPGQSMCQCGHQQREFTFANGAAERAAQEYDAKVKAEVWDEAAEAIADWMANNPGPSGIPHDPPRNPYDRADRIGGDRP